MKKKVTNMKTENRSSVLDRVPTVIAMLYQKYNLLTNKINIFYDKVYGLEEDGGLKR